MSPTFSSLEQLILDAAGATIRLLRNVGGPMRPVADQGINSAASTALQAIEGFGRQGRDRRAKLRGSYAESREASAALTLLVASGDIDRDTASAVLHDLDRARARLYRVIHPRD